MVMLMMHYLSVYSLIFQDVLKVIGLEKNPIKSLSIVCSLSLPAVCSNFVSSYLQVPDLK